MNWEELVASALVGTARRPPAVPDAAPGSALGEALAGIDRGDPEAAVLEAGAVVGLYRQAGTRALRDTGPLPAASPPEVRGYISPAAADRLGPMLGGRFRPVLGEWLGLVAAGGRLVPPAWLPSLLDTASSAPALRSATAAVIGERGRWLAGRNPAWAWVGGGEDGATWATGSSASRRLLLARLRADDPAAARELLASTWATETPDDRPAFVAALATGLSLDDEPFLESALEDRRKEVRQAAAELLWRLPDSRLAARMAARARPLAERAALPDEVDKAMVRDGVVAKPPSGVGERAWWFHQLVAAAPLRTWTEAGGETPGELVRRAAPALRQAWAVAAARQGDEAWALALLSADDVHQPGLLLAVTHQHALRLVTGRVLQLGLTPAVLDLLDHCPPPWDATLSRAVVDSLGAAVTQRGRPDAAATILRDKLPALALRLDPSVTADARAATAEHGGWWSDVVGWFLDLLTFRTEMREELPT